MHQLTFNPGLTLTGFRTLIPALGTNQNSKLTHVVEAKRGIPWVPKVFSRVVRTRTRAAKQREKTSGAERFDLLC